MAAQPLFLGSEPEADVSAAPLIDDIDLDRLFDDEVLPSAIAKELAKSSSVSTLLPNVGAADVNGSLDIRARVGDASISNSDDDEDALARDRTRRVYAKLDHERLCGPKGLRALRFQTRSFRPKSLQRRKSQSQQVTSNSDLLRDLDAILSMYRLWAHQCLPKVAFRDFERTASKLCRSRRVHQYVAQLKGDEQRERTQEDDHARSVSSGDEEISDRVGLPAESANQISSNLDGISDDVDAYFSPSLPQDPEEDNQARSVDTRTQHAEIEDDEDEEGMEALRMLEN